MAARSAEEHVTDLPRVALCFHRSSLRRDYSIRSVDACWFTSSLLLRPRCAPANSKIMSTSLSNTIELPIEILEKILLYLPGQDIFKIEVVWGQLITSGGVFLTLRRTI